MFAEDLQQLRGRCEGARVRRDSRQEGMVCLTDDFTPQNWPRTMLVNGPFENLDDERLIHERIVLSRVRTRTVFAVVVSHVGTRNEPSPTISARGGRFASGGNDVATPAHEIVVSPAPLSVNTRFPLTSEDRID